MKQSSERRDVKSFSPLDFARLHREKTGLGAIAFETAQTLRLLTGEQERDVPSVWDPDAEQIPENFARAGQVFKDKEGVWHRWTPQTTKYSTGSLKLPEGQNSFRLTYRGEYSHGFNHDPYDPDAEGIAFTGAGWDSRLHLCRSGWTRHGRTFTDDEIYRPLSHMPREQMIRPERLSNEEVQALGLEK